MSHHSSVGVQGVSLVIMAACASLSFAQSQFSLEGASRNLTQQPVPQFDPAISGDLVVYTEENADSETDIRYLDLTTDPIQSVGVAVGPGHQRLSDIDEGRIVYVDAEPGNRRVFLYEVATGLSTPLGPQGDGAERDDPTVSGERVAYERIVESAEGVQSDIAWLELQDVAIEQVIPNPSTLACPNGPESCWETLPEIGGEYIVFQRSVSAFSAKHVFVFHIPSGEEVDLGPGFEPHTDGRTVVFSSVRNQVSKDVFLVDLENFPNLPPPAVLPYLDGNQTRPRVDGEFVSFDHDSGVNQDVVVMHWPSGAARSVGGDVEIEYLNDISGNKVAFTKVAIPSGDLDVHLYEFSLVSPTTLYGVAPLGALSIIDPDAADSELVGPLDPYPLTYMFPSSLALRPSEWTLHTWANATPNSEEGILLTIDPCTGLANPVDPAAPSRVDIELSGLAFSPLGRLYGARVDPYELVTIDPDSGALTSFTPLGISAPLSLAFAPDGKLYGAGGASPKLYEIDPSGQIAGEIAFDIDVAPILSFTFDESGTIVGVSQKGPSLFTADTTGNVLSFQQLTGDVNPEGGLGAPEGLAFGLPCAASIEPSQVNFGNVELGSLSTQFITVSNLGGEPFELESVSDPGGDFSVNVTPGTVAPGDSLDIEVTFAPASEGAQAASIDVLTSLRTTSVTLAGSGVQAEPPPSEQISELLDFFDDMVVSGELSGSGGGNSAQGRRGALRNMIEAAGDLLADPLEACRQLQDAYLRTDGDTPPPDFVEGQAAAELAARIQALRDSLDCP